MRIELNEKQQKAILPLLIQKQNIENQLQATLNGILSSIETPEGKAVLEKTGRFIDIIPLPKQE